MIGNNLDHYRILDQIGAGGMGVVYRAHDEQLERDVAIKVLRAGMLEDLEARKRFRQEALALARINHPNIATLYSVGQEDDTDFLVMEFIPGKSLSDHLLAGPLPIPEVMLLAQQIAQAMAAAHKTGVIHRDLKPGNIRLTPEGRVKVLDFGLARHAPRPSSGDTVTITQTHDTSGTIPYMSPEQLRGQPGDERSDIWGIGTVLYELVCGKRPFDGNTPTETAANIIHRPPHALRPIRPDVPAGLERIIQKCLEKEPSHRYASAEALLQDLAAPPAPAFFDTRWFGVPSTWFALGAAAIVLIAAVAIAVHFARSTRPVGKTRRAVAVLGFKNLKGDESQAWMSTALSEMLTTELAAGEELRAVSGEDVTRAKMDLKLSESESLSQDTLQQVRSRLGSDWIVAGSYLDLNGQVRVDMRLQNVADGTTVASLSESGPEDQLFAIVTRAGAALRARCGIGELTTNQLANVRASQPANLAAAKLYAEGLTRLRQFDAAGAREKFEAAIDADPKDALAHAALASAWSQLGYDARATRQAGIAFELSNNLAREDRLSIEGAYHVADKKWDKAIDVYRTLYNFFPDRVDYGLSLVDAQIAGGRGQDALATIGKMRESRVEDPRIDLAEGRAAASLSDFRRALQSNARAVQDASKNGFSFERAQALQQQCWAYRNLGQLDEARDAGTKAQAVFEENRYVRGQARSLSCVGTVLSDKGDLPSAQQMYEKALALAQSIGARLDIAGALNNIGNMLAAQGRLEESTAKYQQALAVAIEIDDKSDQRRVQSNIGGNLLTLGEFRRAQRALASSIEIAESIGDQQGKAESLINLAAVCLNLGELGQAELHSREALAISRSLGLRADIAYALAGQGDIQMTMDDLPGAAGSYKESLQIRQQLGDPSAVATSQLSLASLAIEQGDIDQALQIANQVVVQLHQAQDTEQEMVGRNVLARALLLQHKVDQSQTELIAARKLHALDRTSVTAAEVITAQLLAAQAKPKEAVNLLNQLKGRARAMDYAAGYMQASLALAEVQTSSGDLVNARHELQQLKDQASRLGFKLVYRRAEDLSKNSLRKSPAAS